MEYGHSTRIAEGWAHAAPFDAIIMEGATEFAPEALFHQLKDGGRLLCVLGVGPGAKATLYRRAGAEVGSRTLFDAVAPVLPGFVKPLEFAF